MEKMINLNELLIGVFIKKTGCTHYFKDLTEATIFAADKISKGYKIEMRYCDKYGNRFSEMDF